MQCFPNPNHIFQQDSYISMKLIHNEQIAKKPNAIQELMFILKKRENFWILNLCTPFPDGSNQELNQR